MMGLTPVRHPSANSGRRFLHTRVLSRDKACAVGVSAPRAVVAHPRIVPHCAAMPYPVRLIAFLLLLAWPTLVGAFDAQTNPSTGSDDQEEEVKSVTAIQEEAAVYRLARDRFKADAAYEAGAAAYLTQARSILKEGRGQALEKWYYGMFSVNRRARWLALDGFKVRPYSKVAGDLLATAIDGFARAGDINGVYRHLVMLWYYLPDYPAMQMVMETAQAAAERSQDFESAVNLEASEPADVVRVDGDSMMGEVVKLYRFHALHGDRETVGPRAALGLARALMHIKAARDIWMARREYERFLDLYPDHPLTFNALCEQALCYLVTYRGADFDVGALADAQAVINQAEVEARGDAQKLRKVAAYRKRIRLWHQDRDLNVADWYADRVPGLMAFLQRPGQGPESWNRGARYYYKQVVTRDGSSPQGRAGALRLDQLPPAPPDVLLTPVKAR